MTKPKAVFLTLIFSVALNLFFVGGILYRVSTFSQFGPRPIPPSTSWIVRDLSEDRQLELAPFLEQDRVDGRSLRQQLGAAQRRVDELIGGNDFDANALRIAFAELRETNLNYQQFSHDKMLTLFEQLSPEERAAARDFKQRRGPRQRRGGDRRPPDLDNRSLDGRPPPPL
ncbi:MAG: periplasmic heavy metal sensor [Pseudohongiellaceae bacterium]